MRSEWLNRSKDLLLPMERHRGLEPAKSSKGMFILKGT